MKENSVTVPRWFDRHLHIRDGEMMKMIFPYTFNQCATGAVIMPNLIDPITTIEKAKAYRERITALLPTGSEFLPCMTLYLTDDISPQEVVQGFKEGAWVAVKLYMANKNSQGGTTGSSHGVKDIFNRYSVFQVMEKYQIPLLGHFEAVEEDVDEFDREIVSVNRDLKPILMSFPGLPVVFEHLTDGRAADFVAEVNHNIYATVTAHHLMINRNAMFWGGMNPAYYCKPVPKSESHRVKVRDYVTSGNTRFGAGTDSAPHTKNLKSLCYGCAAGIFTAPVAVEMYTTVFDEDNALQHLGPFLSENFLSLYGMQVSSETMTIKRQERQIPKDVWNSFFVTSPVKVFKGGSKLPWKLVG